MQNFFNDLSFDKGFCSYFLSSYRGKGKGSCFFIAAVIAFNEPIGRLHWCVCEYVLANGIGADGYHILACSLTTGIFENCKHVIAFHIQFQSFQFCIPAGLGNDVLTGFYLLEEPVEKCSYFSKV